MIIPIALGNTLQMLTLAISYNETTFCNISLNNSSDMHITYKLS